jgi:hypothetical protein
MMSHNNASISEISGGHFECVLEKRIRQNTIQQGNNLNFLSLK